MQKAAFLMHFLLFAVKSVVRKFNLKTSIGGGILAKHRINLNETASQSHQNAVSTGTIRRFIDRDIHISHIHISNTSPIYLQYISNFSPIIRIGEKLEENWRKTGGSLVQLPREYLAVTSQLPRGYRAVTSRLPRACSIQVTPRCPLVTSYVTPKLPIGFPFLAPILFQFNSNSTPIQL